MQIFMRLVYFQKCHTSLIFMADKRPWHPARFFGPSFFRITNSDERSMENCWSGSMAFFGLKLLLSNRKIT